MSDNIIIREHYYGVDMDILYHFVVYGIIPEIGPLVSFRRIGGSRKNITNTTTRKLLKCPHCSARLTDIEVDTKVVVFKQSKTKPVKSQFYMKCAVCKKESGVTVVNVA